MADERGRRIWALTILAGAALLACGWLLPYAVSDVSGHRGGRVYLAIVLHYKFIAPTLFALLKLGLLAMTSVWVLRGRATPLLAGLILGIALYEAGKLFVFGPLVWGSEVVDVGAGAFAWSAGIAALAVSSIGLLLGTSKVQSSPGGLVRVLAIVLLAAEASYLVLANTAYVGPLFGRNPVDLFMELLSRPGSSALWILSGLVLSAAILVPLVLAPGSGKFGAYLRGAALGLAVVTAAAAVARALIWGVHLRPPPDRVVVAHTIMLVVAVALAAAIVRTTKSPAPASE